MTECSCRWVNICFYVYSEIGAYGDARERAGDHVRGEGKVGRESFIAGVIVSGLFPAVFVV